MDHPQGLLRWLNTSPADAGGAGDAGSVPGLGRSPGGGNGSPLQCYCLEKPVDGGAWRATGHSVAEAGVTSAAEQGKDLGRRSFFQGPEGFCV